MNLSRSSVLAVLVLVVSFILSATLTAQVFPPVIDKSDLDGLIGYSFQDSFNGAYLGVSAAIGGDINNDGIDDMAIGDSSYFGFGVDGIGRVYVVFGSFDFFESDLDSSALNGTNGFIFEGVKDDATGQALSFIPDVNGDDLDDLLIGAPYADGNGISGSGEVYVVYGSESFPAHLTPSDLNGTNGFVVNGASSNDYLGFDVASLGDVNGDELNDFVLGVPQDVRNGMIRAGSAIVIFGSSSFDERIDINSLDGTNGFTLEGVGFSQLGTSVAAAGDFNVDGMNDFVVGAFELNNDAGGSYGVFGATFPFPDVWSVSELDGSNGLAFTASPSSLLGLSVSGGGDFNADGNSDLLIGSLVGSEGVAYVVFGDSSWDEAFDLDTIDSSNGLKIEGYLSGGDIGAGVSFTGDINNDSFDDILTHGFGIMEVYTVFGGVNNSSPLSLNDLDGHNGFVFSGVPSVLGRELVVGRGDINGDEIEDTIIGSPSLPIGGEAYVIYGRPGNVSPLLWPLEGGESEWINSGNFGEDYGDSIPSCESDLLHPALDLIHTLGVTAGKEVIASQRGRVRAVFDIPSGGPQVGDCGKGVLIENTEGTGDLTIAYEHIDTTMTIGTEVARGAVLGTVKNITNPVPGLCTGTHLHYAVWDDVYTGFEGRGVIPWPNECNGSQPFPWNFVNPNLLEYIEIDPVLSITGGCGMSSTIAVDGGTPEGNGYFYFATDVGTDPVSIDICQGVESGLTNPGQLRIEKLDRGGLASFDVVVPSNFCGTYLQLLDQHTCRLSNVAQLPMAP